MTSVSTSQAKLTKRLVDTLAFVPGRTKSGTPLTANFIRDTELTGFALRITDLDVKSYIVAGRVNGIERRLTIGRHGPFTVEQAREQAREMLRGFRLGVDPQEEKAKRKAQRVTLREVVDSYLRDRELKASSIRDIERHVTKSFAAWEHKPVTTITRDACRRRFSEMSAVGPAQANQAFRILRALLRYARGVYRTDDKPILPENPVEVLNDAGLWNRQDPRTDRIPLDRVGTVFMFLRILRDARTEVYDPVGADYLSFLMLTGSRRSVAAALTWDRVKLTEDAGTWHIPKELAKNGRAVTFPLSAAARDILATRLARRSEGEQFVFNTHSACGHVMNVTSTWKPAAEHAGTHVTLHGLRRTFIAIADKCGVSFEKAKLLLHHAMNDDVTIRHYTDTENLHESCTAEAEAIGAWIVKQADLADDVAAGRNVVPLRANG